MGHRLIPPPPLCMLLSSDMQNFGCAQGQHLGFHALLGSTSWISCMPKAVFLTFMHAQGQLLDFHACPEPTYWLSCMPKVNFLTFMHANFFTFMHAQDQLLDFHAYLGPTCWLSCISRTNLLTLMHALGQLLHFNAPKAGFQKIILGCPPPELMLSGFPWLPHIGRPLCILVHILGALRAKPIQTYKNLNNSWVN